MVKINNINDVIDRTIANIGELAKTKVELTNKTIFINGVPYLNEDEKSEVIRIQELMGDELDRLGVLFAVREKFWMHSFGVKDEHS